jgi:hypothetical protein
VAAQAKAKSQNENRLQKRKKVQVFEKEQERWKNYMYQKIANEARKKAESDTMKVAVIEEARERKHVETESQPVVKESYLDSVLRTAAGVPGARRPPRPASVGGPASPRRHGGRPRRLRAAEAGQRAGAARPAACGGRGPRRLSGTGRAALTRGGGHRHSSSAR